MKKSTCYLNPQKNYTQTEVVFRDLAFKSLIIKLINQENQANHFNLGITFKVLDLFAGCGGLSLGFEAIGFQTTGYEMDIKTGETYNTNLKGICHTQKLTIDTEFNEEYDIVIGGPPCQPFSVGGHQKGLDDERNGFPVFIHVIKQVKPKAFMFENVRGMLYSNKWYLDQIIKELQKEGYLIDYKLLNAVNFGVPQNRERVFVVGHKGKFNFPKIHTEKVTVGDAIGDLIDTIVDESKILTPSMDRYVANYEKASSCINPRDLYLHKPARTLTCRNIAAPTGDMQRVKLKDGRRRRISVREAARLQSFPDWFVCL
ncbi:MAG: DNA cytosine methyltransferase [Microscillaceae bacterium]|nr:DNA cytosine methyltransferase [Microscillaceae bacterium]